MCLGYVVKWYSPQLFRWRNFKLEHSFLCSKKSVYVVLHIYLYIIHQPQIQVQCLSVILLTAESILLVF